MRNLGEPSRRVWLWMCTFANVDDPGDNHVSRINAILDGLGDRTLVEWLASVETPGVRQIREIAAPTCAKAINAHFLFAGRLELSRDPPLHKSATCIVVNARDYGDPTVVIDGSMNKKSPLNNFLRVVVKFMSDATQFDEILTRNMRSSIRSSDHSDCDYLVPGITYFDTRESCPTDAHYGRDIRESKHVFGHDLMRYPHAFVMHRGDRNFDSIYRQEEPSMLKIRSYMEDVAMQLEKLHCAGRIHADIKPLNIVRLGDVLTLIDVDASRHVDCEKVGMKFSSGILPPEMIYQFQTEAEENQFVAYWKDEVDAFHAMQRFVQESNRRMPDTISELLEEKRGTHTGHANMTLELYCNRSSSLNDMFEKAGRDIDVFYEIWTGLVKQANLWAKISPRQCKKGGKYVVKTFRPGDESGLPYELLWADVSFDLWSFGILLYKLFTKKSLFTGNDVTDDLDDGDSYAEFANWNLEKSTCREKLNAVTNESALDLLQRLLHRSPSERPKRMREVLCHEFFETDFHAKWKALNEELCHLQGELQKLDQAQKDASYEHEKRVLFERQLQNKNQQMSHVKAELKEMVNAMSASDLVRCRKWGTVMNKIGESRQKDLKDLFFEACRHGPPFEVIKEFLRFDENLPSTETKNEELPIHLTCYFGTETKVMKTLIDRHRKSLVKESGLDNHMTPLQIAQASQWKFNNDCHVEVIELLRKETYPHHFDSLTGLPKQEAFHEWAHVPPPGVEKSNAYAILPFLDVSGFKAVNDKASYAEGDSAIQTYSVKVLEVCKKYMKSADADLYLTIECFRMGGDEFAIVGKFAGDEFGSPTIDNWDTSFRQLVRDLACLEVNDTNCPPRYCTFLRIGCCTGRASDIEPLREKAEELQKKVKENIQRSSGVQRGESISLTAIGAKGIPNFLVEL